MNRREHKGEHTMKSFRRKVIGVKEKDGRQRGVYSLC